MNMKTMTALILLTLTAATTSFAAQAATDCQLVRAATADWRNIGPSFDLSRAGAARVNALPSAVKLQLIDLAKRDVAEWNSDREITTVLDAVRYLRDGSESADLAVSGFHVGGRRFSEVAWYPGGNPYGAIYKYGTAELVATLVDGDVVCE